MDKLLVFVFIVAILVGCQRTTQKENISPGGEPKQTNQVQDIENYLAANVGGAAFGGRVFCAYDVLATEQAGNITTLYLWALCLEYYREQQQLEKGAGVSLPVALTLQNQAGSLRVLEHKVPGDGKDYGKDIKAIFPQSVWSEIFPSSGKEIDDFNNRVERLENATEEKAKKYVAQSVPTSTSPPVMQERLCLLVNGGQISGAVTHAGNPAPDGTFVSLVFAGGPLQKARTQDGRYALPLLARQCDDDLHWTEFELWAGGAGQNVQPDRADYHLDLEAPEIPPSIPPDTSACEFVLGTVSGAVTIGGMMAPDGTAMTAKIGPGAESLDQTVLTAGGRYTLTSVGTRCDDGTIQFLHMTLSSQGTDVTITPSQERTLQDIAAP
jgi:hypothetical protein